MPSALQRTVELASPRWLRFLAVKSVGKLTVVVAQQLVDFISATSCIRSKKFMPPASLRSMCMNPQRVARSKAKYSWRRALSSGLLEGT